MRRSWHAIGTRDSGKRLVQSGVACLAVLAAVSACSGDSGGDSQPDGLRRVSPATHDAAPVTINKAGTESVPPKLRAKPTPIEAYIESPRQLATLAYAQKVLAAQCMHERGFEIKVVKFEDLAAWYEQDAAFTRSRWFGLTDAGAAKTYGYGEPKLAPEPTVDNSTEFAKPGAAQAWDGTADSQESLGNDPDVNGCNKGSEMQVRGVSGLELTKSSLAEILRNDSSAKAQAKPEYGAVYRDLGECMQEAGYDIPDPAHPFLSDQLQEINRGMEREAGKPAAAAEIKLAETDIACKVKVDFVRRLEAILSEEQRKLIDVNALALDEEQDRLDAALKRATAIIEGNS